MRITAPPIRHPCFYGIDRPQGELIAAQDVEEIRRHVGADSLAYLSLDGLCGRSAFRPSTSPTCFNGATRSPFSSTWIS